MESLYKVKTINEIVTSAVSGAMHIGVTINWFCSYRSQPVVPFELALPEWKKIMEGDHVDDRQLSYYNTAATYIDERFTYEEAQVLREYLTKQHSSEIIVETVSLPLDEADVPFSVIQSENMESQEYGFINLPDAPALPLQFPVRGFFDTRYATTLERYQVLVVRSLTEFQCPSVDDDSNGFQDIAQSFKQKLSDLRDSLVNLKNVFDILSDGLHSKNYLDINNDQQPDDRI